MLKKVEKFLNEKQIGKQEEDINSVDESGVSSCLERLFKLMTDEASKLLFQTSDTDEVFSGAQKAQYWLKIIKEKGLGVQFETIK